MPKFRTYTETCLFLQAKYGYDYLESHHTILCDICCEDEAIWTDGYEKFCTCCKEKYVKTGEINEKEVYLYEYDINF